MKRSISARFALLIVGNMLLLAMLGFYRSSDAAPQANQPPFANAVEQRQEIIAVLKEIRDELKAQTALLRPAAGKSGPPEQKR
jgi:hypothetical protein